MDDAKKFQKFRCEKCDYFTSRKSQYTRHLLTDKHKMDDEDDAKVPKGSAPYFCECGKEYKHRQGLWKHKKICNKICNKEDTSTTLTKQKTEINILTNLVLDVVKQNNELTNKIVDLCKEKNTTYISNHNINSNNRTFNLNVFLNETCKDAMNIMDFVDSIQLQLSDLEKVGEIGFINGISDIIIKNLKKLDITKRPVHCTDSKREILYIKDDNKWEKEQDEKNKIRKAVKKIANKNTKLLPEFKAKYPDYNKSESIKSEQYNKLVIEAMGGSGDNDLEKEDKIIKRIAKEVIVNKDI